MVEEYADTAVIIRTSWLYSSFGNNFVKTIIKHASQKESLNVVFDQIGTPTYAGDLAKVILDNLDNINYMNGVHIFNFSNEGVSSWYDFAKEIVDLMHIDCKINPITTKEYPLPAPRPAYSILNKAKIKEELNIAIPHWKDSLKVCIKELKAKL
jgi:dTDP-4-dehydrorhamnose reductase